MKFYGVENRRFLDSSFTPYSSLLANLIVRNYELYMGQGENPTLFSNKNTYTKMDTAECTDMIPTSALIHNFKNEQSNCVSQ